MMSILKVSYRYYYLNASKSMTNKARMQGDRDLFSLV